MSESWIELCRAYRVERYPLRTFLPIAVGLAVAASAATRPQSWILSGLLIFQFRLWDDLGDVDFDRINHPGRVLVKAGRHAAFYVLLISSGLLNLLLATWLSAAFITCLAINVCAVIWYYGLPAVWRRSFAGRHFTLLKYPMFVCVLAGTIVMDSMAFIYLCAAIYELLHDQDMRLHSAWRAVLTVELFSLAGLIVVILSGGSL